MSGPVYRVPCPHECGRLMRVESKSCRSCAQTHGKRTAYDRPHEGIAELEPMRSYACRKCCYRITDERSVVADAVKHHEREAH